MVEWVGVIQSENAVNIGPLGVADAVVGVVADVAANSRTGQLRKGVVAKNIVIAADDAPQSVVVIKVRRHQYIIDCVADCHNKATIWITGRHR